MDEAGGGFKTLSDYASEMGMNMEKVKYGTPSYGKAFACRLELIYNQLTNECEMQEVKSLNESCFVSAEREPTAN